MIYVLSTSGKFITIANNPRTFGELKQAIVEQDHYYKGIINEFKVVVTKLNNEKPNFSLDYDDAMIPDGNLTVVLVQKKLQGAAFTDDAMEIENYTLEEIINSLSEYRHRELVLTAKALRVYCEDKSSMISENFHEFYLDIYNKLKSYNGKNYTHMTSEELLELLTDVITQLYNFEFPNVDVDDAVASVVSNINLDAIKEELLQTVAHISESIKELTSATNVNVALLNVVVKRLNNIEDALNIIDESRQDEVAKAMLEQVSKLK